MIFLKRLSAVFFINLVFKPALVILKFIFYKVLVKLYLLYFSTLKRLGLIDKIKNKSAVLFVNQRLVHVAVGALTIFFVIFNLTQKTQAMAPDEVAGKTFLSEIISSEFSENDQLIEEYFDEQAVITPVQQTYLDNLTAFKPQSMAEMTVPEDSDLDMENLTQGGDAIKKPDLAATSKTVRQRQGVIDYIVRAGDTISTIAANFGISVNTILWENDLNAYSLIRPGNKLAILPITGVMHKTVRGDTLGAIASKYGIDSNMIMETNKLASAEMLSVGQKLIIPGGQKIYYASSQAAARNVTSVSVLKDLFKPKNLRSLVFNKLAWPTVGARITQYFSWAHHAIDIANHIGTPIYACDAGIVEVVGWGTGYGNQIIIDHGGGRKSRYAHLSKFYVSKGNIIKKGEAIATMGSTGNSTGSHLHFEYIINGIKYNPLNYLK
ncbi:M23 family metallopeptidase [Patescibacteria group bacterium]|nr:M23 family metallopeptidase [Patescibacteria group bacterium]MBU1663456.1 M23 family metallopeptidase [Patescibacteria group bacterium]MBU1934215.1 M23 family metallopeptidase [Patescibacteria group bacterium]MBU2007680.1 M23 family metallopeptidase [Patescibacteria group bacterium]MBU2233508.1 M23 family metallopeptidase [Patescibacteria group bacterium]